MKQLGKGENEETSLLRELAETEEVGSGGGGSFLRSQMNLTRHL